MDEVLIIIALLCFVELLLSTITVEARKLEYDRPPTQKPVEEGKPSLNHPTSIFQLSGAYGAPYHYH